MDLPTQAIIDVLTYLLPGFIAASIWYNLTPSPRPAPFERIVQALILTMVVQVEVLGLRWLLFDVGRRFVSVGVWSEDTRIVWSVILAMVLGLLLAYVSNTDKLHAVLRRMKLTHQTSYSSEWYGAFCRNDSFVVLHLVGQRRLYGWPEEWPSTPTVGHFVIAEGEWLDDGRVIPLTGVQRILIPATEVEMVEFMTPVPRKTGDSANG